ncbi:SIMPL domain-containing protein [Amorphus sp. MBR-141]
MRRTTFAAAIAILALAATASSPSLADNRSVLTVTGQGEAHAAPDMATITVGAVSEADTASEALTQNSSQVTAAIDALKAAGVEPRDIQTTGFSVSPRYVNDRDSNAAPRIDGYRVSNSVMVRVRKLDALGSLLDTLVKAGANDIGGISFGISEADEFQDTARIAAVADARHKAELYAKAAGVRLGHIRSIDEGGGGYPVPQPMMRMKAMEADAAPIEAGEQTISASVRVVYEILPADK